jgi:hypothetical protein
MPGGTGRSGEGNPELPWAPDRARGARLSGERPVEWRPRSAFGVAACPGNDLSNGGPLSVRGARLSGERPVEWRPRSAFGVLACPGNDLSNDGALSVRTARLSGERPVQWRPDQRSHFRLSGEADDRPHSAASPHARGYRPVPQAHRARARRQRRRGRGEVRPGRWEE